MSQENDPVIKWIFICLFGWFGSVWFGFNQEITAKDVEPKLYYIIQELFETIFFKKQTNLYFVILDPDHSTYSSLLTFALYYFAILIDTIEEKAWSMDRFIFTQLWNTIHCLLCVKKK